MGEKQSWRTYDDGRPVAPSQKVPEMDRACETTCIDAIPHIEGTLE